MTRKKKMAVIFGSIGAVLLAIAVAAVVCVWHFIGFAECVGGKKYGYSVQEIHVEHDGIDLYGQALIPDGEEGQKFPTVIYAHGIISRI